MPQSQVNIPITSPGYGGINTENSPLDLDYSFCAEANNCTIDKLGRVASRRGFQAVTTNADAVNGLGTNNAIESMAEFIREQDGQTTLFACGNKKIFVQNTISPFTLVEVSFPNGYETVDLTNNWQMAQLNNKMYFVHKGLVPLVYTPPVSGSSIGSLAVVNINAAGGLPTADGRPGCVHAAFGRLWYSNFSNNSTVVAWSSILNGEEWGGGGSGRIQTSEYWPSGYGNVTAITAHNNFMIIFGSNNILVYQVTSDVINSLKLVDTIEGIGCLARDSLAATGEDFIFCDASGFRSLNRTLQDSTLPLGDVSANVRNDVQFSIKTEVTSNLKAVFHKEDSFYVCFFPSTNSSYVFDSWQPLPTGAFRTTRWNSLTVQCGVRTRDRVTYFGGKAGVYRYVGATDTTIDYSIAANPLVQNIINMEYTSHPLNIGSTANTLIPKQVDVTLVGGLNGKVTLTWGYNFETVLNNQIVKQIQSLGVGSNWTNLSNTPTIDEDNVNRAVEWTSTAKPSGTSGLWTAPGKVLNTIKYNIWGSGKNLSIGLTAQVSGSQISIQEINIQTLQGRLL